MKTIDRYLRDERISRASAFVNAGDVVVDIGCSDGAMFEQWKGKYKFGYGVDPDLAEPRETDGYALYPGLFPGALPQGIRADVITMLAVLEHLPPADQFEVAAACYSMLREGGRVVITVPSPRVDDILHLGGKLRLLDGMSVHEHYGFKPEDTLRIFGEPLFRLVKRAKFQFSLNNLFVFEKCEDLVSTSAAAVAVPVEREGTGVATLTRQQGS